MVDVGLSCGGTRRSLCILSSPSFQGIAIEKAILMRPDQVDMLLNDYLALAIYLGGTFPDTHCYPHPRTVLNNLLQFM